MGMSFGANRRIDEFRLHERKPASLGFVGHFSRRHHAHTVGLDIRLLRRGCDGERTAKSSDGPHFAAGLAANAGWVLRNEKPGSSRQAARLFGRLIAADLAHLCASMNCTAAISSCLPDFIVGGRRANRRKRANPIPASIKTGCGHKAAARFPMAPARTCGSARSVARAARR